MTAYLLSVVAAVLSIVVILEMLRRRRVRERYATLWLIICASVLVVGPFPGILA